MRTSILLVVVTAGLVACGGKTGSVVFDSTGSDNTSSGGSGSDGADDNDDNDDDDTAVDDWTGSSLIIESPRSGTTLPYGEDSTFTAVVIDADGNATDFDDLTWTSTVGGWTADGADFDDDALDVGRHDLTVTADLPDGTRLRSTVGGVKVQHPDAGTYVGNLVVDISGEFNDFPITASCVGAAIVSVDAYGEGATGDSTCVASLLGYSTDITHVFDFGIDGDTVSGTIQLDLSFFQLDFEAEGDLDDGVITADWATDFEGFVDVAGSMEIERVTDEVDLSE